MVEGLAGLTSIGSNLGRIHCNVLVCLLDLRVCHGGQSSKGTLLVENSLVQCFCVFPLILAHDLAGLLGAGDSGCIASVLLLGLCSKGPSSPAHLCIKSVLRSFGIHCHAVQEILAHCGTGLGIVSPVPRKLGS